MTLNTDPAHYGIKQGKPGRAYIRTRDQHRGVGIIIGTNTDGEATLTLYINHGPESVKAKVRLSEFHTALETAIRTAP